MGTQQSIIDPGRPLTVGSIGSALAMRACDTEMANRCDAVELRMDILHDEGESWRGASETWRKWSAPLLITARVPAEGGRCVLSPDIVREMASSAADAALWDVELATWRNDQDRRAALLAGWGSCRPDLVLSFHDFSATPSLSMLRDLRDAAIVEGADVFKVATMLQSSQDLDILLELQHEACSIAIATMGMGPMGPESRIRCAVAGSVLNYGYLGDAPTAPGQWEAGRLREQIQLALQGTP